MKLFKKVAAAVLAGVMALSMAACTPNVPVDPVTPDAPVAGDAASEVLYWMNYGINKKNANPTVNEYDGSVAPALYHVVNDADLKAKASAILDAIAADEADWNTPGQVIVTQNAVNAPLNKKNLTLLTRNVYVLNAAGGLSAATITTPAGTKYGFTLSELKYTELTAARKATLDALGQAKVAGATADVKIGIASKVIAGTTYLVIVDA